MGEQLKSELSSLQTELSQALANAKSQKQDDIARLSAEFESRYTAMQQKHQREIDELARQALADESELIRLRSETKDVSVYKSQVEKSEKQLIVVREQLGATEKKLADFLALYGEERKVLEESRKLADELDRIKRRYATSMDIDESTIDEISSKVTLSLEKADDGEKMQAM